MREDISIQVLSQVSENIQKLSDLSTRIDERVKAIQSKQGEVDDRLADIIKSNTDLMHRLIVLEQTNGATMKFAVDEMSRQINVLDKRMAEIEGISKKQENRWAGIFQFLIQLIWIGLAAWMLFKMGLNPPPVP